MSGGPERSPGPRPPARLEEPPVSGPPPWILYVDLDAYYVACELRDRPDLLGRPVIVGPPPSTGATRGVVLSASYEARAFGVRSALPAGVAARLCPEAVWIPPDFAKYERIADEVRALLRRRAANVVPYSIDEAAVTLPAASAREAGDAARAIQAALKGELGLSASIGISTSRTVAKMASDRAKPGGVLVVPPDKVKEFVAPLPVRAVPGVGPRTEELLDALGIQKVGDLAGRRPREVARQLGGFAIELIALADGTPMESFDGAAGPHSRSADHTFDSDVGSWGELEPAVRSLAERLGEALREEGWRYGTVGIAFRWGDFERSQRSRVLPAAREGARALADGALRLGRALWDEEQHGARRRVRTVSVRAERLTERRQAQAILDEYNGASGPERERDAGRERRTPVPKPPGNSEIP